MGRLLGLIFLLILAGMWEPDLFGPPLAYLVWLLVQPHMAVSIAIVLMLASSLYAAGWNARVDDTYQGAIRKAENDRRDALK